MHTAGTSRERWKRECYKRKVPTMSKMISSILYSMCREEDSIWCARGAKAMFSIFHVPTQKPLKRARARLRNACHVNIFSFIRVRGTMYATVAAAVEHVFFRRFQRFSVYSLLCQNDNNKIDSFVFRLSSFVFASRTCPPPTIWNVTRVRDLWSRWWRYHTIFMVVNLSGSCSWRNYSFNRVRQK